MPESYIVDQAPYTFYRDTCCGGRANPIRQGKLMKLQPKIARMLRSGQEVEILAEEVEDER